MPQQPPAAVTDALAPVTGLQGMLVAVNIYDERMSVSVPGRILHMPETTIVGQEDLVSPPLDDAVRSLVRSEVSQQFAPGAKRFDVDVYVTVGRQSFLVGEMREMAEVRFAVRIEVIAVGDVTDVRSGEGAAILSTEGVDLPRADVEALYVQAVQESLRRGFLDVTR